MRVIFCDWGGCERAAAAEVMQPPGLTSRSSNGRSGGTQTQDLDLCFVLLFSLSLSPPFVSCFSLALSSFSLSVETSVGAFVDSLAAPCL